MRIDDDNDDDDDDIEAGNGTSSSHPSLKGPVAPDGASTIDTSSTKQVDQRNHKPKHDDDSHTAAAAAADFDTVDLPEEQSHSDSKSLSSTASVRTSRADLVEGTNTSSNANKYRRHRPACFSRRCRCRCRRVKYMVGAALVTILAGTAALLLCLYNPISSSSSDDSSRTITRTSSGSLQPWTWTGDIRHVSFSGGGGEEGEQQQAGGAGASGGGIFGDQVFVSDDGRRVAIYSYTTTTFNNMSMNSMNMSMGSMNMSSMSISSMGVSSMNMGNNMGNSAVTFYDCRTRVVPTDSETETEPETIITWVPVAQLGHNDTGPVVAVSGDGTMIASAYPAGKGQSSSSSSSSFGSSTMQKRPIQTYRLTENERTGIMELVPVGSGLYIVSDSDSEIQSQSKSDGDFVGTSLALSKDGTRMVVGAGGSSYGTPGGNYAVVYDLVDGDWWAETGNVLHGIIFYQEGVNTTTASRLDLCQENLGATVAMSSNGKRIALAAPNSYVCDLSRAGGVYVYEQDEDTNEWIQVGKKIQLDGIVRNDAIGSTLSISDDGNRLAIGTEGKLAAVVELNSETQDWEIVGEVFNLYSEQPAADLLTKGVQVALSGNGMRLALTAPFGGPPSELDGMYTTSGYVKVFEYNANDGKDLASVWKPVGRTVSFEDEFGTSADLSADGTTLVTGWHYYQSGNQTVEFDGLVRVYSAPDAAT